MSREFRIATFNLESLDDTGEPPFEERVAVLRPQLERLRADILCLQEVNAQRVAKGEPRTLRALNRLLEGTPYAGYHVTTGGAGNKGDGHKLADRHNLVLLSRWPIAGARLYRHDLVPAPQVRMVTADPAPAAPEPVVWDRPVLHAEVDLPGGRRLHVFDLHLRAPIAAPVPGQKKNASTWKSVGGWAEGFYLASLKRAGQALETRLAVDRLFDADPQALVVVAGDLNAELEQTPVRIIRADLDETGNGHLAGRSLVPLERSVPEERRFSVLHGGEAVMLDHLLVSRALLGWFRRAEIHNEALGDELIAHATVSHSPESYHAPLVAHFEMPE
ncbi:endonuclease/exonuclease/phosphatase family protein [Azospirillum rugosum]|uniref:Endonuclease/exonuclease/phosphatase family metal-dependent hydrolase n=1 Tax=Azospirillum rugosum TaxID=416170 RepID=A0ABS4SUX3_9PROT|nr:endonuclease/exonuclease/phosphatase family protein [Azospirillum rugosum]MBP2296356.1 endonuclease/exonuclease/phosphatase family metal-dependent hydrolase [Azospirillum rugosum]MDQ0529877.1 endonuclease/exonuclease/phosphatase family metal-dependent hydrolase [Azospirillum rugosum]